MDIDCATMYDPVTDSVISDDHTEYTLCSITTEPSQQNLDVCISQGYTSCVTNGDEKICVDTCSLDSDCLEGFLCLGGSCWHEFGCTDTTALNYDGFALTDDGTCKCMLGKNEDDTCERLCIIVS